MYFSTVVLLRLLQIIDKDLKDIPHSPQKKRAQKFEPLEAELPEWISPDLWRKWVEFRQQIKKFIKTEQGLARTLQNSTTCVWPGLFEPRGKTHAGKTNAAESQTVRDIRAAR
ncbi:hypothetical protein CS369_20910 [Candidatus Symbiopectobacterium sp. 'North America']|nr:hypothetical protein [Candidatus Symbiopectobacterium sp. 'North America']